MERREQPINGSECDIVYCRHQYKYAGKAGVARYWKSRINRRARRKSRKELHAK